ncbi:MAG TPA: PEP-CTERM sorting domain-containing protein [Bryobacteraceae bacterium]|nr:PEP-CTERM sorting domain-containing protein [Bryobacteraceae bacterium]
MNTGVVTPIFTGVSPHGGEFVTFTAAGVPEPAPLGCALAGLGFCAALLYWRKRRAA